MTCGTDDTPAVAAYRLGLADRAGDELVSRAPQESVQGREANRSTIFLGADFE
jgi:hypothetical protein